MLQHKIYKNNGNASVLKLVNSEALSILDVGCGAGDNARALKKQGRKITGVTLSIEELSMAQKFCDEVLLDDIEKMDVEMYKNQYDTILLSHVCEHLFNPTHTIAKLIPTLQKRGKMIIAVPNMSFYRNRIKLLKGDWSLSDYGPFDRTHLHFYDYFSVEEMIRLIDNIQVEKIPTDFAVPLWPVRKIFKRFSEKLDHYIGSYFPNLFCQQIILVIQKIEG